MSSLLERVSKKGREPVSEMRKNYDLKSNLLNGMKGSQAVGSIGTSKMSKPFYLLPCESQDIVKRERCEKSLWRDRFEIKILYKVSLPIFRGGQTDHSL